VGGGDRRLSTAEVAGVELAKGLASAGQAELMNGFLLASRELYFTDPAFLPSTLRPFFSYNAPDFRFRSPVTHLVSLGFTRPQTQVRQIIRDFISNATGVTLYPLDPNPETLSC